MADRVSLDSFTADFWCHTQGQDFKHPQTYISTQRKVPETPASTLSKDRENKKKGACFYSFYQSGDSLNLPVPKQNSCMYRTGAIAKPVCDVGCPSDYVVLLLLFNE